MDCQHFSPEQRNVLALEYHMVALCIPLVISHPPKIAQKFNYSKCQAVLFPADLRIKSAGNN